MIKKISKKPQNNKRNNIINIKIMINENHLNNQIKKIRISNKDVKYNESEKQTHKKHKKCNKTFKNK